MTKDSDKNFNVRMYYKKCTYDLQKAEEYLLHKKSSTCLDSTR